MRKSGLAACLFALAATLAALPSAAQAPAGGVVVESLRGDLRAGTARLAQGARVNFPATLNTGPGAQALLRFGDGTQVVIDESSQLRIVDARLVGGAGRAVVDLAAGAARFVVPGDSSRVSVRTAQGTIDAAAPSDFSVAVGAATYLSVEDGSVAASSRQGKLDIGESSAGVIRRWESPVEQVRPEVLPAQASSAFGRLAPPPSAAAAAAPAAPAQAAPPAVASARRTREAEAAAAARWRRVYVGGSFGQSRFKQDIVVGPLIDSGEVDTSSNGYKVFAGYQFLRHLGVELAYVDLGKAKYAGTVAGTPVMSGELKVRGANLSGVGILPLGDSVALFGKLGVFAYESDASDDGGGTPFSSKANGTKLSFGAGVDYAFKSGFGLRAEFEGFKIGTAGATLLSLGAFYKF